VSLIWSCPDCWTDLEDNYWDLWCPECERAISWMEFAADLDPYDERRDFLTMEEVNADGV
jgi:hypothetical protein